MRRPLFAFTLTTSLLALCSTGAFAQSKHSTISVGLGYVHVTTRDDGVSSLLSKGGGGRNLVFLYAEERDNSIQDVQLAFSKLSTNSGANNKSDLLLAHMRYSYYLKANPQDQRFAFGGGPAITMQLFKRDFHPRLGGFTSNETTGTWATLLQTAGYAVYLIKPGNTLTLKAAATLMGYVIRNGYANTAPDQAGSELTLGSVLASGSLRGPGKLQQGHVSLEYSMPVSAKTNLTFISELGIFRSAESRTLIFASNAIFAQLTFVLAKKEKK